VLRIFRGQEFRGRRAETSKPHQAVKKRIFLFRQSVHLCCVLTTRGAEKRLSSSCAQIPPDGFVIQALVSPSMMQDRAVITALGVEPHKVVVLVQLDAPAIEFDCMQPAITIPPRLSRVRLILIAFPSRRDRPCSALLPFPSAA
jgi:hypothetical protein